jgi:hypothetical protein
MRPGPCRAGILERIPPEWLYIRCRESGAVPHPPVEAAPAHPDLPAHVPPGKTSSKTSRTALSPQPSALSAYLLPLPAPRFPLCASRSALSVTTP